MNRRLVFNIETVGDSGLPPELVPSPNDFSEFKKETTRMEKAAEAQEKIGLSPMTGKIICISICDCDNELIETNSGENERELLVWFNDRVGSVHPTTLIGFNSKSFDLPFIAIKMVQHGIKPTFLMSRMLQKYSSDFHIDVRQLLGNYESYAKGTLVQWSHRMGVTPPYKDGSMVNEWYVIGAWDEIRTHCNSNVLSTKELFVRCADVFGV